MELFIAVTGAIVALVVFRTIGKVLANRRAAARAKQLGCKEPPSLPHHLPFGLDTLQDARTADREQRFPELYASWFDTVGALTIHDIVLGESFYATCDPKNMQAMLATQFHEFVSGDRRRNILLPMIGPGIFTADGKDWEHSRALLRPQFAREEVSDLDLEERHLQNLMQALPVDSDGWTQKLDLQVFFFRFTLDSASEFLFGESVDSQLAELAAERGLPSGQTAFQEDAAFSQNLDIAQHWVAERFRFRRFYWLCTSKEFKMACRRIHDFIDHFVERAISNQLKGKELKKEGREKFVLLEALAAQTQDPTQLRSQLLHILLAGRDSTASLLGWIFYILARHPAVFDKLRQTIIETFGTYDDPQDITFTRLKCCKYLQHTINETLRLYPVAPFNHRQAVRDTTLPRGGGPDGQSPIFIRKGQSIHYSVYVMQRRKDIWGDDAEEWKPERWQNIKPTWNYLPFNGGPRTCLGQQFALTEASYVIVRLLQRFDKLENLETDPVVKFDRAVNIRSGTGVKVRLHEAR